MPSAYIYIYIYIYINLLHAVLFKALRVLLCMCVCMRVCYTYRQIRRLAIDESAGKNLRWQIVSSCWDERWCCLLVLNLVTSTPQCIRQPRRVKKQKKGCLGGLALMTWKSRMVLAALGLLLTPHPSSTPPKTPHQSYSDKTRSRIKRRTPPPRPSLPPKN